MSIVCWGRRGRDRMVVGFTYSYFVMVTMVSSVLLDILVGKIRQEKNTLMNVTLQVP